ncbi:MAG: alpha/beta hydrolase [Candidatus Zixiibacteriota bacterium]
MPFIKSNSVKIYYEVVGSGDPVIFLHGFSLDRTMWKDQVESFSKDYQVFAVDARGHGKSDAPETGYAREDRAEDILNLANELGLEKFHLVGFSMGGGDALSFAIDHQDRLMSLTLIGTVAAGWVPRKKFRDFSSVARENGIESARTLYIKSSLSHYETRNREIKEKLEKMMTGFSGKSWTDPKKGKYLVRDDLRLSSLLELPVLIIIGQHDIFFRPLAEQLNESIFESKLEIVKDTGHMVNMETPEKFNKLLSDFLAGIVRGKMITK